MPLTAFQAESQRILKDGKSLLLVAPTGLGKTLAVTADLEERFSKTIYAVPLRALGFGIRNAIASLRRAGEPIRPVIHHGDQQDSHLFGEEVVVTTYDQVVCGVPGLPLSLPLKAGHAVAGALLMSRLILDEAHLAWAISPQALVILLGIVDFRRRLGLPTVLLTATLPTDVATTIAKALDMECRIVGEHPLNDEGLALRDRNRDVQAKRLALPVVGQGNEKRVDTSPLDDLLSRQGARIYFANTVERLQDTYDRLACRINPAQIIVLHNRMPRRMRSVAERRVEDVFGKGGSAGDWLLLTNQVAEAGLDISAPLVVSDPAPVDTLVQRSGRCARWFRDERTKGVFYVVTVPKAQLEGQPAGWAAPYRQNDNNPLVSVAVEKMPSALSWTEERRWVDQAWGVTKKEKGQEEPPEDRKGKQVKEKSVRVERLEADLTRTTFALNLFDRAVQNRRPGEIAGVFREILSAEIAVEDFSAGRNLQGMLDVGEFPETSSVSLGRGWSLTRSARGQARAVRYVDGDLSIEQAEHVQPGDILIVPSTLAYLHPAKGLCFLKDGESRPTEPHVECSSRWGVDSQVLRSLSRTGGRRQELLDHARGVMEGTRRRLTDPASSYRTTLVSVLRSLEPAKTNEQIEHLAEAVAAIATVGAGFHDLGKTDRAWQGTARSIDPASACLLIGRTSNTAHRIGKPHAHAAFRGTLKACEILMGSLGAAKHLVAAIALAAARHHSAFLNPALSDSAFEPHEAAEDFVAAVLADVGGSELAVSRAREVLEAAASRPPADLVPLLLPNDDAFPVYALVGRAILMADREDAAGPNQLPLERWKTS